MTKALGIVGFNNNIARYLLENQKNFVGLIYFDDKFTPQSLIHLKSKFQFLKIHTKSSIDNLIKNSFSTELIRISNFLESNKFSNIVLETMIMMDRLADFKLESFGERYNYTLNLLIFWEKEIKQNKIEKVFFSTTPHEVYDFAFFNVCKVMNIETFILREIPGFGLWELTNHYINSDIKKYEIKKLIKESGKFKKTKIEEMVVKNSSNKYEVMLPYYVNLNKNRNKKNNFAIGLIQKIKNLVKEKISIKNNILIFISYNLGLLKTRKDNYKFINKTELNYDFMEKNKFAIFYLHFQPERTTSPLGEKFADQFLAVLSLRSKISLEIKLIVKEHPQQISGSSTYNYISRRFQFYQKISKLPNTQIIFRDERNLELLDKAILIGTVSGTIGFQAYCRNKPVIVFGNAWYENLSGVFRYNDEMSLSLESILKIDTNKNSNTLIMELNEHLQYSFTYVPDEEYSLAHGLKYDPDESYSTISEIIKYVFSEARQV